MKGSYRRRRSLQSVSPRSDLRTPQQPQMPLHPATTTLTTLPHTTTSTIDTQSQYAQINIAGLSSTGKGIVIGMLSAFGSAALVATILIIIYFFRYTGSGRILLDRLSRPGEFDDEQEYLRQEAEALTSMDELQRAEYARANGMLHCS